MGAFDKFEKSKQPDLITVKDYTKIAKSTKKEALNFADQVYIPPCNKLNGRDTTKDIDIFLVPKKKGWKNEIIKHFGDRLVVSVSNGRQLMCVVKDVVSDGKQYFLDFNAIKNECFEWSSTFYNTSSLVPIVVGRFATSLGYKLTDTGLKINLTDSGGVQHIETLTKIPEDMFRLLMLDEGMFNTIIEGRYLDVFNDEVAIALWISQSQRFCHESWVKFKPNNAHKHATRKDSVKECLSALERIAKNCKHIKPYNNDGYFLEEFILGEGVIDDLEYKIEEERRHMLENGDVVDGRVLMTKLGITGGPIIGKLKKRAIELAKADTSLTEDQIIEVLRKELNTSNATNTPKS